MLRRPHSPIHPYYQSNTPCRLPVLNPGPITEPCIISTDGIARANRTRLVNEKDRQLTARRVEDRVKVEERINKVGKFTGPLFSCL